MYHLFDKSRNQYITSTVSNRKHGAGYALFYGEAPVGCRWATEKGARMCIERLVSTGSVPAEHQIVIVYEEGQR